MSRIITTPARFARRVAGWGMNHSHRLIQITSAIVGVGIGLVFALPPRDIKGQCPPAHEGLVNCALQKQWLPVVMTVVVAAAVIVLLVELALATPAFYRRAKRGEILGRN